MARQELSAKDEIVSKVEEITSRYWDNSSALIQVLLEVQRENRWLSQEVIRYISHKLNVPLVQVYQVATFYKAFSLLPRGKNLVSVCMGTACQVRGAPRLLDKVKETLKVKPGETTDDRRFSLETVNCLGCCALGPVMVVNDEYYGKPMAKEVEQIPTIYE